LLKPQDILITLPVSSGLCIGLRSLHKVYF